MTSHTVHDVGQVLAAALDSLPLIDTHEHMERLPSGAYPGGDLFDILSNTFYLWADLVSSGMPPDVWQSDGTGDQKWGAVRRFLPSVRTTGYYRTILRGLQSVYSLDIADIDDANFRILDARIREAYSTPGWPETVLRERTHIETVINDVDGFDMNPAIFLPSLKIDYLLKGNSAEGRAFMQAADQVRITSFDDYVGYVERMIDSFKARGAVALKTVTPYYRSLNYMMVPEGAARAAFTCEGTPTPSDERLVEDFAFHIVLKKATELQLPVQIHTGMLAGNWVALEYCNPSLLNPLFHQYPDCTFILFHGGYPFADELGVLAKTFPNVFLDLCWLPWISPALARRFLDIWIDLVPLNKFMWGGDAHRAECVHGHWLTARDVVIEVLKEKVARRDFSADTALAAAKGIFRNNAVRLFRLNTPIL